MRTLIIFMLLIISETSIGQVRVSGYYRKNGTYVQPYYRSNPDGNPYNNWSYPGNVNPYTGKVATGDPNTYLYNYYNRNSASSVSSTNTVNTSSLNYSSTNTYSGGKNLYTNSSSTSVSTNDYGTYYVSTTKVNIRSGPSTFYSILATLSYGDKVEIVGVNNYPWYMLSLQAYDPITNSYKTKYGYVEISNLTTISPLQENAYASSSYHTSTNSYNGGNNIYGSSSSTDDHSSYYIANSKVNVRNGPSPFYSIVTTLSYGDKVEIVGVNNYPWYMLKLQYYDPTIHSYKTKYGYVESSNLTQTPIRHKNENYETDASNLSSSSSYSITSHPYGKGNGRITLWTDCNDNGYISVYIDEIYEGHLTSYFNSMPDCASPGTLSLVKPSGYYKITAEGSKKKWEMYVYINADECILKKLQK